MTDFIDRHLGPRSSDADTMLKAIGVDSIDQLLGETVPAAIWTDRQLNLPPAISERSSLERMKTYADKNQTWRSYIGLGYHGSITPSVILLKRILEVLLNTCYKALIIL